MKNRKKKITLLVIAILVIVSMIAGATYAFFKAQIGPAANFDINATTSTTDNLTFSTDGDIVLNVTADNLKKSGGDLSNTAIARARLIANNASNDATAYYNIYLLIEENEMEYSSYTQEGQPNLIFMNKEKKEETDLEGYTGVPEIVLSVKKDTQEYKITKRLTATEGGYDITEAEGLYAIGEDVKITTTSDVTDTWEVKVTFKNLEYNQQLNTGKSLKGKIIITAEKLLYEIKDAEGLRKLSEEVNSGDTKEGKYYVLTNNIDLGNPEEGVSNFTPIGTNTNRFKGNFNGDNHTISNINMTGIANAGLFGYVENATFNNIILKGDITNATNAGGLICNTYGETSLNKIYNYVNLTDNTKNGTAGGLIALAYDKLRLNNSYNEGKIIGEYASVGGLIGRLANDFEITNSYNNGIITNNNIEIITNNYNGDSNTGGIVGNVTGNGKITNCYNTNEIKGTYHISGLVALQNGQLLVDNSYNEGTIIGIENGSWHCGGIVGGSTNKTIVKNSFNSGNLKCAQSTVNTYAGGILGYSSIVSSSDLKIIIENTYNKGNIESNFRTGGLVGLLESDSLIYNSYNLGDVLDIGSNSNNLSTTGGLIGQSYVYEKNKLYTKLYILNSYNKGSVTSQNFDASGIIGYASNGNNLVIANSYNEGNISSGSEAYGIVKIKNAKNISINNLYNNGELNGKNNYIMWLPTGIEKKLNKIYYEDKYNFSNVTTETGNPMTINQMKYQNFANELNNNINSINLEEIDPMLKDYTLVKWKLGEDGYPTLDF